MSTSGDNYPQIPDTDCLLSLVDHSYHVFRCLVEALSNGHTEGAVKAFEELQKTLLSLSEGINRHRFSQAVDDVEVLLREQDNVLKALEQHLL